MRRRLILKCALLVCAMAVGHGSLATADPGAAGRSDPYADHEEQIRAGMEGSRADRESHPDDSSRDTSVQQLKIDTSRRGSPTKDENAAEQPVSKSGAVPPCPYASGMKTASLVKAFSTITWHVCVRDMGLKGLWVGPVHLKRGPSRQWISVINQAGLAEIYVPYESGGFRPYDMQHCPTGGCALDPVTNQDKGPTGTLIQLTNETTKTVVTEVRDRGVAWLCKQASVASRRGQEFLVWGVVDGGNYDNIVQYGFRDDGVMTFRMGNTGYNWSQFPRLAHTHNGLWFVDMDLDGAANIPSLVEHVEPYQTAPDATEMQTPFDGGTEGGVKAYAEKYTSVLVEDASTNAFGNKIGYRFSLAQHPVSRHYEAEDDWTQNDFYLTRYRPTELGWMTVHQVPDNYVLAQAGNNEPLTNKDVVVWVKSTAPHVPTDEDRSVNDLSNPADTSGVTLTHWSGFNVEPNNLFDANPLGIPRCGV